MLSSKRDKSPNYPPPPTAVPISLTGWPPDERDTLGILARQLATEHANVQIALLKFNLGADSGGHISDGIYMRVLASLARLSLVGVELRSAILSYRTTAHVPVVKEGGDA